MPHLLGHRTVDVLGDAAGHQIDRDGTNEVPAKSGVVLQTIAGAVLEGEGEQGGKRRCQGVAGALLTWPCSAAQAHLAQKVFALHGPIPRQV